MAKGDGIDILGKIAGPQDLRDLTTEQLEQLADEIRKFLITSVANTGGHLGPNLGVVELSIALHQTFNSPVDLIVWDTGHQSYVHKILTGRKDFSQLRQKDGIAGYPQRAESEHDVVESSHASSSLSWADGISRAFQLQGHDRWVIAVIGDGALTGGMAWEALNNLADAKNRKLMIVVNDNGRSYGPTSGGLANALSALRAEDPKSNDGESPSSIFSNLGLRYIGVLDGHSISELSDAFQKVKELAGPVVVHIKTQKGQGYSHAVNDEADQFHAIPKIDPATGKPSKSSSAPSWTKVFGEELEVIASENPKVVAVTAAMLIPVGLEGFAKKFPERVIDVGIAEQHAVTSAAGLAFGGLHPVVAIYSTFLNRAFDQLLMDVALHKESVTFVLDRAGVTGPDGASHHGMWDISMLQAVPGLQLATPRDANKLRENLRESLTRVGPTVIRFPKGTVASEIRAHRKLGQIEVLSEEGEDCLILSTGPLAGTAIQTAELLSQKGLRATVADPCWISPVTADLVEYASSFPLVITIEDGLVAGGFGSRLSQHLNQYGFSGRVEMIGIPQEFLEHAERDEILERIGITPEAIAEKALLLLQDQAN